MSKMVRSGRLLRRSGAIGVVAGVAVCTAALLTPVAQAQSVPHGAIGHDVIRYHGALPTPGAHGRPFAAPTSPAAVPNIVGGTTANSSDFPGVVGILSFVGPADAQGFVQLEICTGTVITPTEVLTAAHCDAAADGGVTAPTTTLVIAGNNNIIPPAGGFTSGFVATVSSVWTDPSFNLGAIRAGTANAPVDDVKVLTLGQALPSNLYPPVTLTAQGDQTPYAAGTSSTIVGYGITTATGNDAGVLHKATVPIVNDTTCANAMGPGYDATRMTCAGLSTGGVDTCSGDSGGPLFVNGVEAAITDWGAAAADGTPECGLAGTYGVYERLSTYHSPISGAVANPPIQEQDWTGDGHADMLARLSDGSLFDYTGSGLVTDGRDGFADRQQIGGGWNIFSHIIRVTNWDGDGLEGVLAVTTDGRLLEYRINPNIGTGGFDPNAQGIQIGSGFNAFDAIMPVTNWFGDGRPGFVARTPGGALKIYEGNEAGGFVDGGGAFLPAAGFNIFSQLISVGTWRGNGDAALLGMTPDGVLHLYQSNEQGGWVNAGGETLGVGFNAFSRIFSVGDWSGDGLTDLIGVTPGGGMFLYTTDGHGNWQTGNGVFINSGWQAATAIF